MTPTKADLVRIFTAKRILSTNHPDKRSHYWKRYFDPEAKALFDEFSKLYRSEAEAWYCLCKNVEPTPCPICGKNLVKFAERGYNTVCEHCSANSLPSKIAATKEVYAGKSPEELRAIRNKREETCLTKYGVAVPNAFGSNEHYELMERRYGDRFYCNREKIRETNLKNHGGKWNLQTGEHLKHSLKVKRERYGDACHLAKRYETNLKKYGVENFTQTKEFEEKANRTLTEKYGSVENSYVMRNEAAKRTKLLRYGDENYHNVDEFKNTLRRLRESFEQENNCIAVPTLMALYGSGWLALRFDRIYDNNGNAYIASDSVEEIKHYAGRVHGIPNKSAPELFLLDELKTMYPDLEIRSGDRMALRTGSYEFKELDIYIPQVNLGIEYNGLYWHSSYKVPPTYHQEKTALARSKGIHLLHVFEQDFLTNHDEVLYLIYQCIRGTFQNLLSEDDGGFYIGDNSKPVYGDVEVVDITIPNKRIYTVHNQRFETYDCGLIKYKLRENKNDNDN